MSRPKKEIKRETVVKVRLTESEADLLNKLCNTTGMTKSELIRDCIYDFAEKLYIWG